MNGPHTLYQHPDGGRIDLDIDAALITIMDADGISTSLGIGPVGMARLAEVLQREGSRWAELLSVQGLI